MSEWWTYGLSDFLLFSPRTYFRLIELYHLSVWPAQFLAMAAGIVILASHVANYRIARWTTPGLLALAWLWIAWAWFGERYATINWAAPYAGLALAAQGLLLLLLAVLAPRRSADAVVLGTAIVVTLAGLVGLPLLGLFWAGRGIQQVDLFGLDPDPTALVTIGTLLTMHGWIARLALVLPLLWLMVAAATLHAMDQPGAWFAPAIGFLGYLGVITYLWLTRRRGAAADAAT
jgi:hypothetical protein